MVLRCLRLLSSLTLGLAAGFALAADLGNVTVRAELSGDSTVYTSRQPVMETTEDAKFQAERYGKDFAYTFYGIPPGPCRLKLGFCESRWTEPGERVFSVYANGRAALEHYDILGQANPNEAVIETLNIEVPEDRPLVIRFVAHVDRAKVNLLRIYSSDFVLETTPRDEGTSVLEPVQRKLASSERVWETQLGRLGSRVAINPRPQRSTWWQSPLGHAQYRASYFDPGTRSFKMQPTRHLFGVQVGQVAYSLPFNDRPPHFSQVTQTETLTTLSYDCQAPDLPVRVRFTWHAPFYPGDVRLSTAPYLALEVAVTNTDAEPQSGGVVIGRSVPSEEQMLDFSDAGCVGLRCAREVFELPVEEYWLVNAAEDEEFRFAPTGLTVGPPPTTAERSTQRDADGRVRLPITWEQPYAGLIWDFSLAPGETDACRLVYVGWVEGPVLTVAREEHRFKYHDFFAGPGQVARYAFDDWEAIARKCDLFESTIRDATLPPALKQFLAFALHSYLVNTWWTTAPDGADFFSVWEGCCKLQSTVDVEYNIAPLYFQYWPELLRMELDEWTGHITGGVLSHDMGFGLEVEGMKYWHQMEVEENTNFVLLLHQYWTQTGDYAPVRRHYDSVRALLDFITDCDTDGDGFLEEGRYNTIDQGSAAIQHARDQVYLAMRALAAYTAGSEMARLVGKAEDSRRWIARARRITRTLDQQGWLEDHYVVALNQTTAAPAPVHAGLDEPGAGMQDDEWDETGAYTAGSYGSGPASGWDSYSIYTTNGLVYPMRAGLRVNGLNLARLRADLRSSAAQTMREFGSPHTTHESNMWVSQNIWRDIAAAYLGIDYLDNIERYWALQKYINTEKYGSFTDVYVFSTDTTSLDYYPRGVAAFGLINALAGLQINRPEGIISIAPLRVPLRIPLTAFAQWDRGAIPWLVIAGEGGQLQVRVEGADLPEGMEVRVRERGQPFAEGLVMDVGPAAQDDEAGPRQQ